MMLLSLLIIVLVMAVGWGGAAIHTQWTEQRQTVSVDVHWCKVCGCSKNAIDHFNWGCKKQLHHVYSRKVKPTSTPTIATTAPDLDPVAVWEVEMICAGWS